ncbi:hypothetical protein QYM36_009977 [Artemia franciscana]|uniref:Uncharacterized protein n=1 Tax=Artemia franciscana TaxID=6661 RepID=A0AA88HSW2_ARTSF|nr:hypothetical protein QYM36_009977 [Artemia franciscana]
MMFGGTTSGEDDVSEQDIKFLGAKVKQISNIFLKELKGGSLRLSKRKYWEMPTDKKDVDKIYVDKNDPLVVENGVVLDRVTTSSFGPLERIMRCGDKDKYITYQACYTIDKAISVSMELSMFHAYWGCDVVPDSWSVTYARRAAKHFDKLFLNKLNELAGNK